MIRIADGLQGAVPGSVEPRAASPTGMADCIREELPTKWTHKTV